MGVPVFGGLYTFLTPHGFYAPFAQFEPNAKLDMLGVQAALRDSLQRTMTGRDENERSIGSKKFGFIDVYDVKPLTGDNIGFSFGLRIMFWPKGSNLWDSKDVAMVACRVAIGSNEGHEISVNHSFTLWPTGIPYDIAGTDDLSDEQRQVVLKYLLWQPRVNFYAIFFTSEQASALRGYIQALSGDPSGVSGSYYRMSYLSAVVITTLGLGDIVPISSEARFLVATEAMFGVVVAGLFLNALAYRAGSTKA
jgi:hypothetical protein